MEIDFVTILNTRKPGLRALNEGIATLGEDIFCACAGQNMLAARRSREAVKIMRYIADQIGLNNPIERAFATRKPAISAARTNGWRQHVTVQVAVRWGSAASPKVRSERGGVV
jgi:hypothetical protein